MKQKLQKSCTDKGEVTKQAMELFLSRDGQITVEVALERDSVWLTQAQMAQLFEKERSVITKHIRNALAEGEIEEKAVCAFFAQTALDGKTYQVAFYNLDVIISVGYRVKSQRGVEFRKWAMEVLRHYILDGVAVNQRRIKELGAVVKILKRAQKSLDAAQVLSVVEHYTPALDLLDAYDHQCIQKPQGGRRGHSKPLSYEECMTFIRNMRFGNESALFGREKDQSFISSLKTIYQTFAGKELYPTTEEKAANLLYFVIKNHSFTDGNKRIGAALFLYFLDKNKSLFTLSGEKRIADHTLVALTLMIAESKPAEQETMVNLVMVFLAEGIRRKMKK